MTSPCEACVPEIRAYEATGKTWSPTPVGARVHAAHHALIARLRAEVEELRTCFNTEQGLVKQGEELRLQAVKERDEARAALDEMKEYLWNVPGGLPEFEYIARIGAAGQVIKEYEARRALARSEGGT